MCVCVCVCVCMCVCVMAIYFDKWKIPCYNRFLIVYIGLYILDFGSLKTD